MPKRLRLFVPSILLLASSAFAGPPSHSSGSASSHSSRTASSSETVHVRSYTRKDGTVVHGYNRNAPRTSGTTTTTVPAMTTAAPSERDSRGRIKRSAAAKDAFERETGYSHGRKGYVVDHIVPLACGGTDAPSNMQWQTEADAKGKDKTERIGCK